jgi:hypothetical protein
MKGWAIVALKLALVLLLPGAVLVALGYGLSAIVRRLRA